MGDRTITIRRTLLLYAFIAFCGLVTWSCSDISPINGIQNENAAPDNQNDNASTENENENTSTANHNENSATDNGTGEEWSPMVNLQVTEDENVQAFEKFVEGPQVAAQRIGIRN